MKDGKLAIVVLGVAGFGALLATLQLAIPYLRPTPFLDVDTEFKNDSRNVRKVHKAVQRQIYCMVIIIPEALRPISIQ